MVRAILTFFVLCFAGLTVMALLSGCTAPTINAQDAEGQKQPVWLAQLPLCVFLCNNNLSTAGSDIDQLGTGSATNNQSQATTQTGGFNGS